MKFWVWAVLLRYSVWIDKKKNVILRIRILPLLIVLVGA